MTALLGTSALATGRLGLASCRLRNLPNHLIRGYATNCEISDLRDFFDGIELIVKANLK